MTAFAQTLVALVAVYFGAGLLFAIPFAWRGAAVIDPAAREATVGFRVLIVSASALLWPLLLRRWLRRSPPPLEHNAHRDAPTAVPASSPSARAASPPLPPAGAAS